jgi:hypothetical protein
MFHLDHLISHPVLSASARFHKIVVYTIFISFIMLFLHMLLV